ncbi:hypothetical protein SRB5_58400 [Streptomyces sp. RB5]|uniref:Uncharacterized protein n=1 Tax=Streptomyces smaragdinus TaxID=2585196 RepID=A0A7K0CRN2_9ACTN|nr:hypothetical protein [Streptomyces smaragdinus]
MFDLTRGDTSHQTPQDVDLADLLDGEPWGPLADSDGCAYCGATPAVAAPVRWCRGAYILHVSLHVKEPFCRTCGTAVVRGMSATTLAWAWWGIGSFVQGPLFLVANLVARARFSRLGEPVGAVRPPFNRGKPLLRRAAAFGLLVPITVIGLVVAQFVPSAP